MTTPTFSFTFTIEPGPMWEHRSPDVWLHDLAGLAGLTLLATTNTDDGEDGNGDLLVTVAGDEPALRFACVALNLHAEQTPWDSTPTEQGAALERVLSAPRCPQHGPMTPRPAGTSEQAWCGDWYACTGCERSALLPSSDLTDHLARQTVTA